MGQKYEDLATHRTTGSRVTGCEFACDAMHIIDKKGERWKGPDLHPSAQSAQRKRDEAAKKLMIHTQVNNLCVANQA
jgi:hypothetical protein